MNDEDRLNLIRRGNELFNKGDFKNALKIFLVTNYQDGIVRVADHLYYDEKDEIGAIKLYKRAGYQNRVNEFAEKAALTIKLWLAEDEVPAERELSDGSILVSAESIENAGPEKPRFRKWNPPELGDDKTGDGNAAGSQSGE